MQLWRYFFLAAQRSEFNDENTSMVLASAAKAATYENEQAKAFWDVAVYSTQLFCRTV